MISHGSTCSSATQYRIRTAFTVLELLVSISIIGILLALLLPAIGAARESARRVQCIAHLRQVGIALHGHHDTQQSLPAGWKFDPSGQTAFGWSVSLLPFMDQMTLSDRIDRKRSIDDPLHSTARNTVLDVMLCPSDITESTFILFAESDEPLEGGGALEAVGVPEDDDEDIALVRLPTANYVGVFGTLEPDDRIPAPLGDGAFLENRPVRFREFGRGLSNTMVVGERTMAQVPSTWFGVSLAGEDAAARIVGSALEGVNHPLADECDFSSRHPGGANFLWGDGHVSFVSEEIDLYQYHEWSKLRSSSSP